LAVADLAGTQGRLIVRGVDLLVVTTQPPRPRVCQKIS
jgi:hypothetical protein